MSVAPLSEKCMKARCIGPYRYQLPVRTVDFLTADIACTIFPKTVLKSDSALKSDVFVALIPENIWASSLLNQIESLSTEEEINRRLQRLTIGYSKHLRIIDNILDLSDCSALIEFAKQHECLDDDDMNLIIYQKMIRLE